MEQKALSLNFNQLNHFITKKNRLLKDFVYEKNGASKTLFYRFLFHDQINEKKTIFLRLLCKMSLFASGLVLAKLRVVVFASCPLLQVVAVPVTLVQMNAKFLPIFYGRKKSR